MLAYKVVATVFNAIFMLLILLMKKDTDAVGVISFLMIALMAMNIGLIWN